jgi:glycosyltransferase involved in cell wall biosynthesis
VTSLVVTHYRPHRPDGGAPLRNWQNISALSSLGPVDVVSVGVDDPPEQVDRIRHWAPFSLRSRTVWDRIWTAVSPLRPGVYPGVDLYHAAPARRWLEERARRCRYDLAVLETIVASSYADDVRRVADRVVFDAHNVEGVLQPALFAAESTSRSVATSAKQAVLSRRMVATERRVIAKADIVWACSERDAQHIAHLYGRRRGVHVVPNAVDVEKYRRPDGAVDERDSSGPLTMIYPGVFSYPPNEQAALTLVRDVLPRVRRQAGQARVVLVGRNPTPALLEAARTDADVVVTGEVPALLPYLQQPCIVTLPIAAGGGTRLKILEAFAAGCPVVSTTTGAEGIDALNGEHLLLRDSIEAMADAVIQVWEERELRQKICESALHLVRSRYSFEAASARIAQSLSPAWVR